MAAASRTHQKTYAAHARRIPRGEIQMNKGLALPRASIIILRCRCILKFPAECPPDVLDPIWCRRHERYVYIDSDKR